MIMLMRSMLMTAEFKGNSWVFISPSHPDNPIRFDQAIMRVEYQGRGKYTGDVVSVHGIDSELASHIPPQLQRALGISYPPVLSRGLSKLIRLLPGGKVEKAEFQ